MNPVLLMSELTAAGVGAAERLDGLPVRVPRCDAGIDKGARRSSQTERLGNFTRFGRSLVCTILY